MKRPSNPSESLHQRLNAYALAASAAGVSVLALTQAAQAKIVYTKTHHVIGKNSTFKLDLNHDGITDFTLRKSPCRSCGEGTVLSVLPEVEVMVPVGSRLHTGVVGLLP